MSVHDIRDAIAQARSVPLKLDARDPQACARTFIQEHHIHCAQPTLHHHQGVWHAWSGTHYPPIDDPTVRADLWQFLGLAVNDKGEPFLPTTTKINNVLDALRAEANLPARIKAPTWLCEQTPDLTHPPHEIIPCKNGLLHVPTGELIDSTPLFYTHNVVDFVHEPEAPPPAEWLRFLSQLWPDDEESRDCLQELFGYLLTPDTSQQKAFLIVGPKRSGKGTIGRIVRAVVGQDNVCAPTLASLSTNFGLQPLIGKSVAMIADARLGARADQAAIAERLLSVSGEDAQTIDRKFLPAWTGSLPTRFVILTNELPRLADASGALASRFVVFTLNRSFYGREDHGLTQRLLSELPAIFNWALAGWRRLNERGFFVQPASAREAIEAMESLGSPIISFLSDTGYTQATHLRVAVDVLFADWKSWCQGEGRDKPGNKASFGRDLRAAVPGLRTVQLRDAGGRIRYFEGLGR